MSTGWRGTASTFQVPNLTSIPGFEGARPLTGDDASWISGGFSSSLDTVTLLTSEPIRFAYAAGLIAPLYPPRADGVVHRIGLVQDNFTVP